MNIQIYNFMALINAALRGKAPELKKPDWEKLLIYAQRHNIVPLIYEGCIKYEVFSSAPDEIRNKFLAIYLYKISGQINKTQVFLDIYNKLVTAGIRPLVLKGLMCRDLYGELAECRPSCDEDILIRPEEFGICRNILEQNGFVMEKLDITDELMSRLSDISFYHKSGLIIELHIRLVDKSNKIRIRMNSRFGDVYENCISREINGYPIYSMSPTKCFLYLFIHLYKHFIGPGVGIRQMLDLLLYGEKHYQEIEWEIVEKNIYSISAEKLYADILAIGARYFDFHINTGFTGNDFNTLLTDIMDAGIFGASTSERKIAGKIIKEEVDHGRKYNHLRLLFPKRTVLMQRYRLSELKYHKLPVLWAKRICRFLKYYLNISLIYKGIRACRKRTRLLKSYDILN